MNILLLPILFILLFTTFFSSAHSDTPLLILDFRYYMSKRVSWLLKDQGIPIENLRFNPPSKINLLDKGQYSPFQSLSENDEVKSYREYAPLDMLEEGKTNDWVFNMNFAIKTVGANFQQEMDPKLEKNELIGFLIGVKPKFCKISYPIRVFETPPRLNINQSRLYSQNMERTSDSDYAPSENEPNFLANDALDGLRSGCFLSEDGKNLVYFYIIVPR